MIITMKYFCISFGNSCQFDSYKRSAKRRKLKVVLLAKKQNKNKMNPAIVTQNIVMPISKPGF